MYNKCCVVSCRSRRMDVRFYSFPKTEIYLKKWLESINCDKLHSLSNLDLHKHFVCKKHFEKRFFTSSSLRSRLRVGAYPTLFTESEIVGGVPETTCINFNKRSSDHDHNYSRKRRHEDHTYCKYEVAEKCIKPETEKYGLTSVHKQDIDCNFPSTSDYVPTECLQIPIIGDSAVCKTPKLSKQRLRLISTKKSLTPNCTKLYCEYRKSRKQLKFTQRAHRAIKFSKETSFERMTEKMNPLAKKIMWMQIKQCVKKSKGRRFTYEDKLIALSIMKQSPKCYRFLQKIFILPSKCTLNKMISELNIETGINPQIFEAVKQEVKTWDPKKKICLILFDELPLEASLIYDKHKDTIDGFVDCNEKTNDFADHALVFMLRGSIYKWQQPLAFYFCKGATSAVELKKIINDIIVAVGKTGLLPIALACDQGTAFQSAVKSLQEDTRREQIIASKKIDDVIIIKEHNLSVIYDPPHLIKGLRNNFLTKNIKYNNKISKWNDIVEIYKTDCNHGNMRLLHKLNDEHIIPEKLKKMKVRNCVRVFSKTVAATLLYTAQFSRYADGNEISSTIENTAEIVSFFDDLFDSVNGTSLYNKSNTGKPLRQAVTNRSQHNIYWKEAIQKLENIKFINYAGKETSVPSLKNWITTLKSYQRLWQFFQKQNIKIMRPRYFNCDPLENFFGQVRAYNFRNNNPDCHSCKTTFRSLLITRFIKFHSENYNCEEDSGEQLLKLKNLFNNEKNIESVCVNTGSLESSDLFNSGRENILKTASHERLLIHTRAYTAGWVIRKIIKKINCKHCKANLISNEEILQDKYSINNWIHIKEFENIKKNKLTYPAEQAVRFFGVIAEEANKYLENEAHKEGIMKEIKNKIKHIYVFDFLDCDLHKSFVSELFMELTLRLTIFNWCNVINRILKGTDVFRLRNKKLPYMQLKAYNKYNIKVKHKLKLINKRINK